MAQNSFGKALKSLHQEYQYEELVDKVSGGRDTGRNLIFDVVFNFLNQLEGEKVTGLNTEDILDGGESKANFDIIFQAMEIEGSINFSVDYCTGLYREETIKRFIHYFKRILLAVSEDPWRTLSSIELVSVEEKKRLLVELNDTWSAYPSDKSIHQLFEEQAERSPDSAAVIGRGQDTGHPVLTYRELNERSNRLARLLMEKGVQPDTIVGIKMERCIEMIIGLLAILNAGGAYLPVDPDYPEERIEYMLADSGTRVLVNEGVEVIDLCRGEPLCSPGVSFHHSGNLAYVIYTSGTTGRPKGTLTTHRNVIRVVRDTNYIDITPNDRVLQLSNYAFDGSVFDIYGALLNGAALVLVEKEEVFWVEKLANLIRREAVTLFFVTTALFNKLVEMEIDCLKNVRKVLFGGEWVSMEHSERALEYLGKDRVIHVYGPTETTVYATYYFINEIDKNSSTIPIGRPIANTTAYILDKARVLVPIGVVGEVYIGGDGVARGYLNNPQLTAEKFILAAKNAKRREGGRKANMSYFYRTGDLARRIPDGNIEFLGRIDLQVKIRGFRIELAEIETQVLKYHSVKDAVIIAREDKTGDKYLCAYIVPQGEEGSTNASELKEYLAQTLPDYMIPSFFIEIENVPLNPNGKVDKKKLPVPEGGTAVGGLDYVPAGDELEESLVELWSEVLGLERSVIGIDDNFFELGGHSLKATVLVSRIHKKLNVNIPLMELFKTPVIRGLSGYIRKNRGENGSKFVSIEPAEEREYYTLSSAQKRLYILQQLEPAGTAYNTIECN